MTQFSIKNGGNAVSGLRPLFSSGRNWLGGKRLTGGVVDVLLSQRKAGAWEKVTLIRASHCDRFVPGSYVLVPDAREVERRPGQERHTRQGASDVDS